MGSLGLNGGIPWLRNTEVTHCFICKQENEILSHFLFVCTSFCRHFDSLWANLVSKINNSNPTDGAHLGGSELTDRRWCAILALEVVPKNLIFA